MLGVVAGASAVTQVLTNDQVKEIVTQLINAEGRPNHLNPNLLIGAVITALIVGGAIAIILIFKNWRKPGSY